MLRVLVVDDSAVARNLIVDILQGCDDIEVVGTASDGAEAIRQVTELEPDVVTMDIQMPTMDGFEATRAIMDASPTPIVIVSGTVGAADVQKSMRSLEVGALTVIGKPVSPMSPEFETVAERFTRTVRSMATVRVYSRTRQTALSKPTGPLARESAANADELNVFEQSPIELIVIGASTGGPRALLGILKQLPSDFPIPIVIAQHISKGFSEGFADWLNSSVPLCVRIAEQGEPLMPKTVLIAPEDQQCGVTAGRRIRLRGDPPISGFRPSATYLFETAAEALQEGALGIILTGMGTDGADGARRIHQAGGRILAQSRESSVVWGMPKAAIDAGIADAVLDIEGLARALLRLHR